MFDKCRAGARRAAKDFPVFFGVRAAASQKA
jgi:hypothetical protein